MGGSGGAGGWVRGLRKGRHQRLCVRVCVCDARAWLAFFLLSSVMFVYMCVRACVRECVRFGVSRYDRSRYHSLCNSLMCAGDHVYATHINPKP